MTGTINLDAMLESENIKQPEIVSSPIQSLGEPKLFVGSSNGDAGLNELMLDYETKKQHYFRLTQAFRPDRNACQRALDDYMNASIKYFNAKK